MSDPAAPEAAIPTDLQRRLDSIPDLPPQGFGPHVEYDEAGRIVFAPPATLDAEGNNLARMRTVLPQLVTLADELLRYLARINDPNSLLLRRAQAYRDLLHPETANIDVSRILFEGHRLANTITSVNALIAAREMPRLDAETREALTTLQERHHFFAMGTAEGLAMLTEEGRYRREPAEEEAHRESVAAFGAALVENANGPDPAIAPEVAEAVAAGAAGIGVGENPTRGRLLGDSLAGNVAITLVSGAKIATVAAIASTQGPAGVAAGVLYGLVFSKGLEKSQAWGDTVGTIGRAYDRARLIDPAAAFATLETGLTKAYVLAATAEPSLRAMARRGGPFAWLNRSLNWLSGNGALAAQPPPPTGFSEAEVKRRLLASEPIPPGWRAHVRELDFALPIEERFEEGETARIAVDSALPEGIGGALRSIAPLTDFPNLSVLNLAANPIEDASPLRRLKRLRELRLDHTEISSIEPLAVLSDLEYLNLNGTNVADLTPLATLAKLRSLALEGTRVTDLTPVEELTRLRILNLADTKIVDIKPLAMLIKLESLDLWNTKITDISPLRSISNLENLDLSLTDIIDFSSLEVFAELRTLALVKSKITDLTPLTALQNLQILNIAFSAITDLTPLSNLPNLRHINLTGIPKGIEAGLPSRFHITRDD